jgi:hypothetical protein
MGLAPRKLRTGSEQTAVLATRSMFHKLLFNMLSFSCQSHVLTMSIDISSEEALLSYVL